MALTKVTGQVIKNTTDVTVGVLTVTNTLAVGGTVSIGGTLTYEDVTNIDSVGLITARSNILVGSGITLSPDGHAFVAGVSTIGTLSVSGIATVGGVIDSSTGTITASGDMTAGGSLTVNGGGGLTLSTGNVTIPDSIIHNGDTNTKIRFPEADHISMETGGYERARIKGNGNIGIGTNDPNNRLHVYGGQLKAQTSTDDTNTNVDLLRAQCGSTGNALFSVRAADAADNNSDWDIKTNANEELSFTIGGATEKLRITSAGLVGIGTSVPASRLDVRDTSGLGIISRSASTQATDGNKALKVRNNSTTDTFSVSYKGLTEIARGEIGTYLKVGGDDASNGRALTFTSSDTDSVGALHTIDAISGNGAIALAVTGTERLRVQSNLVTVTTTNTSGGIKLVDSSTSSGSPNLEIISKRSDSNGNTSFASNIFLGKNRTDAKVSSGIILGSINFGGNHTDGTEGNISYSASIRAAASGSFDSKSDMPTELVFTTTGENESGTDRTGETAGNSNIGTERVRIDSAGQVIHVRQSIGYVYQYKRSSTQLFIVDNLSNESNTRMRIRNPNGTINYNSGSDYRLKENDVEITDGITRLKKLRPIQFKWKTENNTYDGFFAHEVSEACPQAVDGTKDQVATADDVSKGEAKNIGDPIYQGLDHSKMVPLLTAALQEAVAKIEVLESEVAALKSS